MLRLFLAFLIAVFSAAVLCSLLSTQFVIAGLQAVDVAVPTSVRFQMSFDDLAILQTLLPALSACFLVGFGVAALCIRWIGGNRAAWYTAAGFCSLVTLYLLINFLLEIMPISGARSTLGLATQGLAGGLGGWLFAKVSADKSKETHDV